MPTKTLAELSELCGAELRGDSAIRVEGVAGLGEAGPSEISFLSSAKYRETFLSTRAAAVLVPRDFECPRADLALLVCEDPSASFTRVIGAFAVPEPEPVAGVHPTAVVEASARVGAGAS